MADSNGSQSADEPKVESVATIAQIAATALDEMMKALGERGLTCEAALVLSPPGDEEEVLILQVLSPGADPQVRGLRMLEFAVEQVKAAPERFDKMEDPDG